MLLEYGRIGIFILIGLGLSFLLLAASYFFALQKGDLEKLSPYECGFQPFDDSRQPFDVRFYVVAILFIIFDLEIAYLFPWSVFLDCYSLVFIFLVLLTLGFVYEWKKGGLDW